MSNKILKCKAKLSYLLDKDRYNFEGTFLKRLKTWFNLKKLEFKLKGVDAKLNKIYEILKSIDFFKSKDETYLLESSNKINILNKNGDTTRYLCLFYTLD